MKSLSIKIGLVLMLLLASAAAYLNWGGTLSPTVATDTGEDWIRTQNRINILLLGTDEEIGNNSRTDSIILASIDTKENKLSLLSIPRDTRVNIPGYGENKINAANQLGGISLVRETLSELLKVPIDYYVMTNFDGFKGIVDTLGGVEIDVEQDMKYRVYDGEINLSKGLQRLDGEKALQYVRFRHDKLGDISRTQRQQKFLVALASEMVRGKNIIKLPVLVPQLMQAAETDLSLAQLISLGRIALEFDTGTITAQTLPGNFATIGGGSYWVVDMQKTPQVVLQVFAGEKKDIIDTGVAAAVPAKETGQQPVKQVTVPNKPATVEPAPPADSVNTEPVEQNPDTVEPVPDTVEPVPDTTEPIPDTLEPVPDPVVIPPETIEKLPDAGKNTGSVEGETDHAPAAPEEE